ncbi:MAG: hypothetical protein HLUCCO16_13105 [Phormidium sp. OSCR]|nr:MAG: hypothetical protein HLUCCO16_13105 [Phormidium sp. OSCR]
MVSRHLDWVHLMLGKFEPTRYRAPLPGGEIFEKSPPGRGRGGLSEVIACIEM